MPVKPCVPLLAVALIVGAVPLRADDLWLAAAGQYPGTVWRAGGGVGEQLVYQRLDRADRAYANGIMKLAQVAVDVEGKLYYCSGLDGYVMHLMDGRNEIAALPEIDGQVRDVACSHEPHTIYYSVVPTPQNNAPLADGVIYRRDFWEGAPSVVATVRQNDIGGNWWGTFTIHDGVVYLATTESDSRVLSLSGGVYNPLATLSGRRVSGLSAAGGGRFYLTTGDGNVEQTADFVTFEPVHRASRGIGDVAVRATTGP
jgi:hypothetical protein